MTGYLILLWIITLVASLVLRHQLYFDSSTLLYHTLMMLALQFGLFLWVRCLRLIPSRQWRRGLIHTTGFFFLLFLIIFYLAVIFSNGLWGKTITVRILSDYLISIDDLIRVLPVDAWLVYTSFVLLVLITGLLYWLVHIRATSRLFGSSMMRRLIPQQTVARIVGVLLLAGLSYGGIRVALLFRRAAHFAGEPLMEFVWGPMWYPESLDDIYSAKRQENALLEKRCIDEVVEKTAPDRINMVILIDALRPDHLSVYGYERPTTPFLDSLYKKGSLIRVNNAFSTSSGTLIGVAGLFGSRNWSSFAYSGLNLMKFMRLTGHHTYAFLTGHHRTWYGLTAIYRNDTEHFYESADSYAQIDVDDLTTLKKFESTTIPAGSFIYMHLLSVHDLGKKAEAFRKFLPDKLGLSVSKKTALVNNYDNGVLQADYVIRQVVEKLKRDGLLSKTTLYIVSDHGQLFGEYGQWNHASSINPAVIAVPMLIYDEDSSFYRNREIATLKDIAPSFARRLGYSVPSCWQGHSLGDTLSGFTTDIDIENKSAVPHAKLYYANDSLWLDHFDNRDSVVGRAFLQQQQHEWHFIKPLPGSDQ